jgi:hypothetical protein
MWKAEAITLIDDGHLPNNIVVETIECNHEGTHSGWLSQEPGFRKNVLLQQTIFECSDELLLVLVMAVEWAKIEI